MIYEGDCRAEMAEMEANSVDSIVTDPPSAEANLADAERLERLALQGAAS